METTYILLLSLILTLVSGHPFRGHKHSHSEEDHDKPDMKELLERMKTKSFQRIDENFAAMTAELQVKLDIILDVVESIERKQKLIEFCPTGKCGEHGTCELSESEETFKCTCNQGYGGKHCELTGKCDIELYDDQQKPPMLGRPVPKCDDEGLYGPVQYIGAGAYCVTRDNEKIGEYYAHIVDSHDMTCQCARDKQSSSTEEEFYCAQNGNYSPVVCGDEYCRCQDAGGLAYGADVPVGELDTHMSC